MRFLVPAAALALLLIGCADDTPEVAATEQAADAGEAAAPAPEVSRAFVGTTEPFASEAVYFLLTDRFVDGDAANNYPDQGAEAGEAFRTFDRPLFDDDGNEIANIGYLGGDFRGILDHADYIAEMGFTAIWLTPIVDNPDQAFTGSHPPGDGPFADQGKSGYHGYWGVNFYEVDEHLVSPGLDFAALTRTLRDDHGIKVVLDVVGNHGSPSFTMPVDQPGFGEIYDAEGRLVADHMNREPTELDPDEPLHAFFNHRPDLATLSDLNESNPAVLDYLAGAYLERIEEGAAALRIDTIKHMPHSFWKAFSDRIRADHPDLFMFAEAFSFDAREIAKHTRPENGGISVLDFPGRAAMLEVFAKPDGDFADLPDYLHLDDGVYENPYELMTFYDNHDMSRMDADAAGFINAHNWLFTSRGVPVIYYGSEMGFRAGTSEHAGNRDYFGIEGVAAAREHPIRQALIEIGALRKRIPALQRGLQVNLAFEGDQAAFLRVLEHEGVTQSALVLLNKADAAASVSVDRLLSVGAWTSAMTGEISTVSAPGEAIRIEVPANGVEILLFDGPTTDTVLLAMLGG